MEDALYITLLCLFVSFVYLCLHLLFYKNQSPRGTVLPPGKTGWPVIGETWEFLQTGWKGKPERFVMDRLAKYPDQVFKTNLVMEPMAVFCGPEGNKFLFHENNVIRGWYPTSVDRIILASTKTSMPEEMSELREALPKFLKPESLASYIGIMDEIAQKHLSEKWENQESVTAYPLLKQFTFTLACRLFLSIEDPIEVENLSRPFTTLVTGLLSFPLNIPGTPMNKAIKASKHINKEILTIIKNRKLDLAQGKVSPTQNILLHMLSAIMNEPQENGTLLSEESISAKIIGLLIAGHDTASIALTFIVRYLSEYPEVYDAVYREQMEIAKSKAPGELLNWKDLQQMKYSWNVACEVLRLTPPSHGAFREALVDFTYKGFTIPKGWKLYWSVHSTHKNPEFFPDPYKFDPSRFEGSGPAPFTFTPFGGGKRLCPGKEYARLEILVFMHQLVKRFKWEKMMEDEKIMINPMPVPTKGLPVRLFPHKA